MIDDGISMLVQSDPAVLAICPVGGFYAVLPKGMPLPSWTYTVISKVANYTLIGRTDLTSRRLQIDTYASDGVDAQTLANAINHVLSGYAGTLPDPQATQVQGIFQASEMDFFDEASRTWRRMIEYEIQYLDFS